jgi:sodium-coupled neutral amino acid transporter 11
MTVGDRRGSEPNTHAHVQRSFMSIIDWWMMDLQHRQAFVDCVWTLTLGILGSSCLPVAFALENLGLCFGIALTLIVALVHTYTGTIILVASHVLQTRTYEDMCGAASGSVVVKRLSRFSLFLLLFGTQCASASLLGDCGMSILRLFNLPSWVLDDSRYSMVLMTLCVVLPLSFSRHFRSLDRVAALGTVLVVILCGIVIHSCVLAGFPALKSGDFPILSIKNSEHIPASIGILSFAFYLQPLLLPLLSEMPPGEVGLKITCQALRIVTMGIAVVVYLALGLFAAMRYGKDTQGDVLLNHWIPKEYEPLLNMSMAVYLSSSVAPIVLAMRYLIYATQGIRDDEMVDQHVTSVRHCVTTFLCVAIPTAVASLYPKQSQVLFSITGSTAVCLIAYVFPVYVHLSLYMSGTRLHHPGAMSVEPLLAATITPEDDGTTMDHYQMTGVDVYASAVYPNIERIQRMSTIGKGIEIILNIVVPCAILVLGVCVSLMALMAE